LPWTDDIKTTNDYYLVQELAELMKKGFQRVKVDGTFYEIADAPVLDKKYKHDIDVVVDRIVVRADLSTRLADSMETALRLAEGLVIAEFADKPLGDQMTGADAVNKSKNETHERILFSEKFACPVSGFTIPEIEPRLFSFNNPFGACPTCDGLGSQKAIDPSLIIPEEHVALREGAVAPWAKSSSPYYVQTLEGLGRAYGFKIGDRWRDINEEGRNAILHGTGSRKIEFAYEDGMRSYKTSKTFEGVIPNLQRRWKETESAWMREEIERFMSATPCPACNGYRLKPEALAVKINDHHIGQVTEMSIRKAVRWFEELPKALNDKHNEIAVRILKEIRERLRFLNDVGLDYLTMSRNSGTLSGGESQRIRLASQIGSGLTGVLYVLDEPSIGLHQRDNARLLDTLKHLRDLGNTVIVVEHDEDAILQADHVVDIGPAAGIHGGKIIAEGKPAEIMANPNKNEKEWIEKLSLLIEDYELRKKLGAAGREIAENRFSLKKNADILINCLKAVSKN